MNAWYRSGAVLALGLACFCAQAAQDPPQERARARAAVAARAHPASAGRGRRHPPRLTGEASVYSRRLAGRPMADGTPLDLNTNAAASRQLPLGSRARVTNLGNGRSAEVQIKDRGPYVQGRIIDVSPKTASELGLHRQGVTRVEVTPLEAPRS